jgi:hypothetical protein
MAGKINATTPDSPAVTDKAEKNRVNAKELWL